MVSSFVRPFSPKTRFEAIVNPPLEPWPVPRRPLPDKTKDQEGVTVARSVRVTQRPRNVGPTAPRSPTASEIEAEEQVYEEEPLDFSSPVAAVTAVTAWLGGEDEEVSYSKKDK